MAEQPKTSEYYAMVEVAKVHLVRAFASFKTDKRIPWDEMVGNVPKVSEQVWVDALKETLKHHERRERQF